MLRPLHAQVLIEPEQKENKTASGVILTDSGKEKPTQGVVVAVGPDASSKVRPGDTVVYKQWAGHEVDKYLVVDVVDILCVVEGGDLDEKAS